MDIKTCVCCGKSYFFDTPHMLLAGLTGYYLCADCFEKIVKARIKKGEKQ